MVSVAEMRAVWKYSEAKKTLSFRTGRKPGEEPAVRSCRHEPVHCGGLYPLQNPEMARVMPLHTTADSSQLEAVRNDKPLR